MSKFQELDHIGHTYQPHLFKLGDYNVMLTAKYAPWPATSVHIKYVFNEFTVFWCFTSISVFQKPLYMLSHMYFHT